MKQRRLFIVVLGLSVLAALVPPLFVPLHRDGPSRFVTFDIGQGDALFIETPRHQQILIDGGPNDTVLTKLSRSMPFFDRSLDLVVLTNPDADHFRGLLSVVERYRIGRFLMTNVERPIHSDEYDDLRRRIAEKGIPVTVAFTGQRLLFDGGVALTVLAPDVALSGTKAKAVNDTSVVARYDAMKFSVLLTGDANEKVERGLLARRARLAATVLKVAHHGSKYASTAPFLAATRPALATLSAGRNNRYGHPSPEIVARLMALRIPLYQTSRDGDIIVESDGWKTTMRKGLGVRLW